MQAPQDLQQIKIDTAQGNDHDSGITLSELTGYVVENYGIAAHNAARLKSLQEWVRAQQALSK